MTLFNNQNTLGINNLDELKKAVLNNPPIGDYDEFEEEIGWLKKELKLAENIADLNSSGKAKDILIEFKRISDIIIRRDIWEFFEDRFDKDLKTVLRNVIICDVIHRITSIGMVCDMKTKEFSQMGMFIKLFSLMRKKLNNENFEFAIDLEKETFDLNKITFKDKPNIFLGLLDLELEDFEDVLDEFCKLVFLLSQKVKILSEKNPEKDIYPKSDFLMNLFHICLPMKVRDAVDCYMDFVKETYNAKS